MHTACLAASLADPRDDGATDVKSARQLTTLLIVLACHAPGAIAQPADPFGNQPVNRAAVEGATGLHANAVASFRQGRFSEAYGRFMALADAGHAPSAELALWMYQHGPTLFDKDWDCSQMQLTAWANLAGQPVPTMVGRVYPRSISQPHPPPQSQSQSQLQPMTPIAKRPRR